MKRVQVWYARNRAPRRSARLEAHRAQRRHREGSRGVGCRSSSAFLTMVASVIVLASAGLPAVDDGLAQSAGLAMYEGFRPTFPAYDTGTGFTGAWVRGGFRAVASAYSASYSSLPHIAFTRLPRSGGSISGRASPVINGAIRNLAQTLGADNTSAFISFLLQPRGTLNDGLFNGFFGLTLNGNAGRDLFIGKSGGGALTEYVLEERGGAGQVSSGTPTVVGHTRFLVVKAEFFSGNDVFTLYTDAVPGGLEPTTGVMKLDLDLSTVSAVGIYSTGAFAVDEIRIGSTFADVAPRVSFCQSFTCED